MKFFFRKSVFSVFILVLSFILLSTSNAQASSIGGYTESWKVVNSKSTGETNGGWVDCVSTVTPGTINCEKKASVSNSYSGSLTVSKAAVESMVGFSITKTWETTVSYSKAVKARQKIQYRSVYDNFKVQQDLVRRYILKGNTVIVNTKYVYPRKFSHFEYRVVKY